MTIGKYRRHPATLVATTAAHIGDLPPCITLDGCDLGVATLEDGREVIITWGRNLDLTQQRQYLRHTRLELAWCGADDGSTELIIPEPQAGCLRAVLQLPD